MKRTYSLIGIDGNAFAIMAYVKKAMKETGHHSNEVDEYLKDAMSSDYSHLVRVSTSMIDKINEL